MPLFKTHCFLFILLAVATLVSYHRVDQYQQIGPELLTGNWKFRTTENSRIDITEKGLILFSSDARIGASAHRDLRMVKPSTVLLVSADVKCDNVKAEKQSCNAGRLLLAQNDGKKDRWDLPHAAVALTGSHDWKNYRKTFTIAPVTEKIRLIAQLSESSGSLQFQNIHVYPVHENEAYQWSKSFILSAWGAYFLLFAGSFLFMSKRNFFSRLLLISVFISIIAGIALPGDIKNQVLIEVKILINSGLFKSAIPWNLSKVWHLCFFFLFGAILCVTMRKESIVHTVTIILMLAAGTEFAQLYINGRTALLSDFFIDAGGGIFGVISTGFSISKLKSVHLENKTVQQ